MFNKKNGIDFESIIKVKRKIRIKPQDIKMFTSLSSCSKDFTLKNLLLKPKKNISSAVFI